MAITTRISRAATLCSAALALSLCLTTLAGCAGQGQEDGAAESPSAQATQEESSPEDEGGEAAGAAGDKAAAEALVGTSATRDEIEAAVGDGERFEMSAAGCERGVYAGYFYYDGFSIFTRTYDQGKTFSVVAVNE